MAEFTWNDDRRLAAQLVAEGNLADIDIAAKLGVTRQTIWNWRKTPEFQEFVDELQEAFKTEVRRRGLADRERRVRALNDRWNRLQRVMEERADDPAMANVPGGRTGLLVHDVKSVGSGYSAQVVDLYEVDTGLLKELREHEKQAAQELGQWVEQSTVDQVVKAYVKVDPDDL